METVKSSVMRSESLKVNSKRAGSADVAQTIVIQGEVISEAKAERKMVERV